MLRQSSANLGCRLLFSLKRYPSKGGISYAMDVDGDFICSYPGSRHHGHKG
jgi:hypothetical protein